MKHREVSKESVEKALAGGARNMTEIAHAHGYRGNVSGDVTKVIRRLVPGIGAVLAGVKAGKAFKPSVAPAVVAQPKAAKPVPAVVVGQRKEPYSGKVYGKVYEVAVRVGKAEGEKPRVELVARIVKETGLSEGQVVPALQVMSTYNHQTNLHRSRNANTQRGHVLLVPVEG